MKFEDFSSRDQNLLYYLKSLVFGALKLILWVGAKGQSTCLHTANPVSIPAPQGAMNPPPRVIPELQEGDGGCGQNYPLDPLEQLNYIFTKEV